ncbi:MAG: Competence protein A [Elusimicrobia bacterium ADurb.Bin231]|nr:MAG: Competence protein A [Elusimicrobia bacterium ADurb.Bin231]
MKFNYKKMLGLNGGITGLDIGSSAVKVVQLTKQDGCYWATYAAVEKIENSSDHGSVIDAIKKCIEPCEEKLAACSVSGPEIVVRDFRFPLLPQDEIESAIRFEAAQVSPFDIEQAEFDYKLMPQTNEHISGFLVAAKKSKIERKLDIASEAGVECVLMGVDGLEILNCFTEVEGVRENEAIAILNIGYNFTNLIISDCDSTPFIRDINYAGKIIIDKIAKITGISSETLKIVIEENRINESKKEFNEYLSSACDELIESILESIRFFTINRKMSQIRTIYICGGFSKVSGIGEILNNRLPAQTLVWNPFEKINLPQEKEYQDVIHKYGSSLAPAAGLAMRQFYIVES